MTKKEIASLEKLVIENRDSEMLQIISGLDYIDSITLLQKLRNIEPLDN